MAPRATVRWNEGKHRWMAWVRFPDGSRRKVERVEKADAEADLNELLALRAAGGDPLPRRERLVSFNEVLDEWLEAGCPSAAPGGRTRHARQKSLATIDNARRLLATHVRPGIGVLWVDRTRTERVEKVFACMGEAGWPPVPSTTPGTTSTRPAGTPCAGSGCGPTLCRTRCSRRLGRRRSARP